MFQWNPRDFIAGLYLLSDQWLGRSKEHYLSIRSCTCDNGSDERLAQACGQTHHRAGVEGLLNYVELVVSDGVIGGGGEVSASEASFLVGGSGGIPPPPPLGKIFDSEITFSEF